MTTLTRILRNEGYDLIEGSTRRYKLLQIWLKKPFNEITRAYDHVDHAFQSDVQLTPIENNTLNINSNNKNNYKFHIGASILNDILEHLGLGSLDLELSNSFQNEVSISYEDTIVKEVPIGQLTEYFLNADFKNPNSILLKNANNNNLLIINGIVLAKKVIFEIKGKKDFNADLKASIKNAVEGKLELEFIHNNELKMSSQNLDYFPIAVQAHKIIYDNGIFKDMKLVTDNKIDFFY